MLPPPPHWFESLDATFQLLTGMIAMAVALYAWRGFKWVGGTNLYNLSLAFGLLTVGFLVNGAVMAISIMERMPFDQTNGLGWLVQGGFAVYYG